MIDKSLLSLPGVRRSLPLLALLAVGQALLIAGQALFLSTAITGLWQGRTFGQMLLSILGFLLCFLAREGVSFLRLRFLDAFSYGLARQLREDFLGQIFKLGPNVVQELGTGTAATTVITGIDQVETYIKLVLSKVLNMMVVPLILLLTIFFLDWQTGLVLAIAFPFAIVFMILLGYAAQSRAERQYKTFTLLSNHFLDSLRGIATLKYFGRSKAYAHSIYQTSERFRQATMAALRMAMLSTFALDFFATLSVATVALFLGLRLMNGEILLFPSLAALILAPEYFLPLREFASDYHATLNGKNAFASVNQVLKTESSLSEQLAAPVVWSDQASLSLTDLSKVYEETGRGVSGIDLSFTGFKKIALVGGSGSGKSTLLATLAGFLAPTGGQIALNGEGLSTLTEKRWRESLSFIPQYTYIFSGSLRDNLAFYEPAATDEEIAAAMQLAGLDQLDLGLDTLIGSGGRTLSGGQMQRVALTRAFLSKNRNILLLDEPTAHLDVETELEIKANILPLFENKLVFLATHRLHWLPQMDRVLVLNEGRTEGVGTHEELLAGNAYYQRLIAEMSGAALRQKESDDAN